MRRAIASRGRSLTTSACAADRCSQSNFVEIPSITSLSTSFRFFPACSRLRANASQVHAHVIDNSSNTNRASDDSKPPVLLTSAQVEQFHTEGYIIIEDALPCGQLAYLGTVAREAAKERGSRYVPDSDKQHRPNSVQFEATLHEAMPADQRHRLGPNGEHEATFERREKRIKVKCRNRKEMERAYQKIVAMRQQYSTYKGVDLAPKAPGNLSKTNAPASSPSSSSQQSHLKAPTQEQKAQYEERQRELLRREQQQVQQPSSEFMRVKPQSSQVTNNEGFSHNADDDVDVHAFDKARARESFDQYKNSGKMEADIRKGSHLDEAFAHVYNGPQSWMHVWAKNQKLRDAVFNRKVANAFSSEASIAARVGVISAQLCGAMTCRLYTDTIIQRTPLCNPTPFHHDSSGVNYRDPRGLHATIVLGGSAQPLDTDHGGFVVLPGSHKVVCDITSDGRDMTGFVRPAAWDVGEALRSFPQLMVIKPRALGLLRPGSLLFMNNMLVYANGPNMGCAASQEGRSKYFSNEYKHAIAQQGKPQVTSEGGPALRAELFLDEAPLTYSLSVMPDGVSFDGVRNTWMSKDSHGPLSKMEAGQPLRDSASFPVLFSEIPDTL